jgi:alpha-mannosidase
VFLLWFAEPPSLALVKEHFSRPEEDSFISLDNPGVVLSGIKQSEDGNELVIRLAEVEEKETTINLILPVIKIDSVRRLNIIEFPLENVVKPVVEGKTIQVKIKPHEIVTLGISLSK